MFLDVRANRIVYTIQSENHLIYNSYRLISASKECLKWRIGWKNRKKSHLKCQTLFSKLQNEKPWIGKLIGSFRARLRVRLCFHPNLSSFTIRFKFWIVDLFSFSFDFGAHLFLRSNLFLNFKSRFLHEFKSKFSDFWFRRSVLESLISHLNSLYDLIKFQRYHKILFISLWIRPLFTSILFN